MKSRPTMLLALAALCGALPTSLTAQATVEAEIAEAVVDRMPEGAAMSFAADVGTVFGSPVLMV